MVVHHGIRVVGCIIRDPIGSMGLSAASQIARKLISLCGDAEKKARLAPGLLITDQRSLATAVTLPPSPRLRLPAASSPTRARRLRSPPSLPVAREPQLLPTPVRAGRCGSTRGP